MGETYPAETISSFSPVDLSDETESRRLSAPGLKAFFRIADAWHLTGPQSRQLLGGMSNGKYQDLKRRIELGDTDVRPLGQDCLQRISYFVGITKALRILHSPGLADSWMTRPNRNRMFGGDTPLAFALRGGIPALAEIRRLLDGRRGMNA